MLNNTEKRNPKTTHIDKMDTIEMLRLANDENRYSVDVVEKILPSIAKAVDVVCECIQNGGRVFYVGAGTSGRLAICDATECPPTFGLEHGRVNAIIAGGNGAMVKAVENAEDNEIAGREDLLSYNPQKGDVVIGISASGGAKYVISALRVAKELGCVTACINNNLDTPMSKIVDIAMLADTGAEFLTGSTRLKAGNTQKMILNMISTCAMVKAGYVYENLMINLRPTNQKLKDRMVRIVSSVLSVPENTSTKLLNDNDWVIKQAIKSYLNK